MKPSTFVVDASVALKWFLRASPDEQDAELAIELLARAVQGAVRLLQPPHFHAEVAAVLARLKPDHAEADLDDLLAIEHQILDLPTTYATAIDLAIRYRQHVFDTLYHAVALQTPGAILLTADRRYYAAAAAEGRIALLSAYA